MTVEQLNLEPSGAAAEALFGCCGSPSWVNAMLKKRPFQSAEQLHEAADLAFEMLDRADWMQAFSAHPKLGDLESLKMRFTGNKHWSKGEQAGVQDADLPTLEALAKGNTRYEERFGYIFILCASGLSALQMLTSLNDRLNHSAEQELIIASGQQRLITHLRIDKLLSGST